MAEQHKKVPHTPTKSEILELYPDMSKSNLKSIIKTVVLALNPDANLKLSQLTNKEFKYIIIEIGLPKGFKKSDFSFLDGVDID
ncbi:MAG: hypothetical protein HRT68_14030 [Flavobacteriaceae bacterium]|nr:hypothetical protein [Flavobacteriaceae bacterium]